MKPETILYGRAWIRGSLTDHAVVAMQDGRIVDVAVVADAPLNARRVAGVIVPGFIDVHVHGGASADFMDGSYEGNSTILAFHARRGTTALAATTLSGSPENLRAAVEGIARTAAALPPGAEICGLHLEGPFINPRKAGAQAASAIRPPSVHELEELRAAAPRLRWIVTLAPEIDGARVVMEHFRGQVTFSIGHTAANFGDTVLALENGASHFTHLFNAMPPLHHRDPGVVGAALISTDATVELIADGIHVHPAILRFVSQFLPRRVALITDAVRACGMPDGTYRLYDHDFVVADGAARLSDGTLAGSMLTMSQAVKNMVELAGLPLEMVLPLATEVPARILGVESRKGKLEVGYDADVVALSDRLEIEQVFVRGAELAVG